MTKDTLAQLAESIQGLSPDPMGLDEGLDAGRNLAGFFSLLLENDREQSSLKKQEGGQDSANN